MRKKTTEQFKKEVYDLVGDEYTVIGEYINCDTKIEMIHNDGKNPHKFEITPYAFSIGRRCSECSGKKKKTTDQFKQEVYDLVGDEYTVIGEYINNKKPIKIQHNCDKCHNHKFTPSPNSFLRGSRCPICSGKYCKDTAWFKQEVYDLVGDEYTVIGEYTGKNDKIAIQHNCEKCNNHVYYPTPNNFLTGKSRCDKCSQGKHDSNMEFELRNYIESLVDCIPQSESKKILDGKDIDILTKNNIGFEFNGLRWHSENKLGEKNVDPINYHLNKTIIAESKNIKLIHIFEDEWLYNRDIVKSKIKNILISNDYNHIANINIKNIDNDKKDKFLNANHLEGSIESDINIGVFSNKDLLAIMCFKKLKNDNYELTRFTNNLEFSINYSYELLINYFKNHYKWNKIIYSVDHRWNFKEIFEIKGWKFIKYTDPNYYYTYSNKRYNNNTKLDNIEKYDKIWDCGRIILELQNN